MRHTASQKILDNRLRLPRLLLSGSAAYTAVLMSFSNVRSRKAPGLLILRFAALLSTARSFKRGLLPVIQV